VHGLKAGLIAEGAGAKASEASYGSHTNPRRKRRKNMKKYLSRMRATSACPPRPHHRHIFWSWLGGFLGIATTGYLSSVTHSPLLVASFGATCVLAFGVPDSPLAQPRNIIGGHFLSTWLGLSFLHLFGSTWWGMALAVATAIGCMQFTKTVHPPAGADPLIVMMTGASWKFLVTPVLAGSIILVICAVVFNNLAEDRSYPKYWL